MLTSYTRILRGRSRLLASGFEKFRNTNKGEKVEKSNEGTNTQFTKKTTEFTNKKDKDEPEEPRRPNNNNNNNNNNSNNSNNHRLFYILGGITGVAAVYYFTRETPSLEWDKLKHLVEGREVKEIVVHNHSGISASIITGLQNLSMSISSGPSFEKQVEMLERELGYDPIDYIPVKYYRLDTTIFSAMASMAFPLLALYFVSKDVRPRGIGGLFKGGKKFKFEVNPKVDTTFKDVAGLDEAKQEIYELVDFLKDPSKYSKLGAKIPRGALLVGPPGVGKTLLAKATAGEAGVPFLSVSGSDFVEIFVGVGPSRIREMFATARKQAPSIIFIDEIDAIGRQRGSKGGSRNDERENTLNALLVEMDGFNTESGVIILAGTNRPDVLDKALTRPGRFDRQITLDNPPLADRVEIFLVHLKPLKLAATLVKDEVAKHLATLTSGFSGADIMNCCNEAALIAARADEESLQLTHFEKAIDRIIGGLEKKARVLQKWEKRVVAHHEAGHAIVGWFAKYADPLLKVSIQPRGNGALGFAQYLPKDKYIRTFAEVFEMMCIGLGGRAAERIIFNHTSTGAADDLEKIMNMARSMVTQFGMVDEIGHIAFPKADDDWFTLRKPYSTATERKIDEAVRELVDKAYSTTEALLLEKKELLIKLADQLLKDEVMNIKEIVSVLGERPYGMPDIYIPKPAAAAPNKDSSSPEPEEPIIPNPSPA